MNEINVKPCVVLLILLVLAVSSFAVEMSPVQGQQVSTPNALQLSVQIYDVDLSTDIARINISASFNTLSRSVNSSEIYGIIISGVNQYVLMTYNYSNYPHATTGIIDWALSGDLGKGEYAPFEVYELRFELTHVLGVRDELNVSDFSIDRQLTFARFTGSKEKALNQTFNYPEGKAPYWIRTFTDQEEVFYLTRKADLSGVPFLFWLLIMPTLACLLVLACTLRLSGRENLGNRLTVYLALFIFAPTFFMAIQQYLPLRAGLSIPEVLLINLIINTALFTGISVLQPDNTLGRYITEGIMLLISFLVTSWVFLVLIPTYPVAANPVLLVSIFVYSAIALVMWTVEMGQLLLKKPRNWRFSVRAFGSLFLIATGLMFAGWSFGMLIVLVSAICFEVIGIFYFVHVWKEKRDQSPATQYPV
jgi:hypothetical protein